MGVNQNKRSEVEASEQRQPYSWLTICSECGSLNVQVTAWVFANRDASIDTGSDAPSDDAWCDRCEDHVGTETLYIDDNGLWSVDTICTKGKSEFGTFELSTVVGTRAPIIRLPDGRWVRFEWDALVTAAIQAAQKQDIKAKGFRK